MGKFLNIAKIIALSETKGMITIMKRIICAAIAVLAVILGVFSMSPNRVQAYTSAKQVKKEINTVNKKISQATQASKKAKAKYKSLAAKDKAETAGSYLLLLARIQNTNPFIVSTGGRYYRVLNPSNGTTLLGHYTASVRSAGGSTYYSGLSCTNVTAVKSSVDAKLTQARREMSKQESLRESLINKKNKLKKTLTYRVPSKKIVMEMGDARTLSALCKNKCFNKVTWKSSNTAVVRIKNGKLRAVKAGSTILTAKTSISRKTTKIPVTVKGVGIISTSLDKSELQLTAGQSVEIGFKYDYDEEESYAVESGVSSNESVATVSMTRNGDALVKAHGEGIAVITLTSYTMDNKKYIGTCTVTVTNPVIEMSEEKVVLETKDFPYTYTIPFRSNIAKEKLKWSDDTDKTQVVLNYEKAETGGDLQAGTATITFSGGGEYEFFLYHDYDNEYSTAKKARIVVWDTNIYKNGKPIESISILKNKSEDFSICDDPEEIQEVTVDDPNIVSAYVGGWYGNKWDMKGHSPGRTTAHIRMTSGYQIDIPVLVYDVELAWLNSYGTERYYDVSNTLSERYEIEEDGDNQYYWMIRYFPQETEKQQITVTSSDEDVVEIGEYVDGKVYFTLRGGGDADITITTPFWSGTIGLYVYEY